MSFIIEKIKHNKYGGRIVFIILSIVFFSIFAIRAEETREPTYFNGEPEVSVLMESGSQLYQEMTIDADNISSVSLMFGTFLRSNEGCLVVTLYDNDSVIQQWIYDTNLIVDNAYTLFKLDQPYQIEHGHNYSVSVEDDYEGENALAIYKTIGDDGTEQLSYRLNYNNQKVYCLTLFVAFLILVVTIVLIFLDVDERWIMSVMAVTIGISYFCLCPLGMVPDEIGHILRAYEVSHGHIVSEHIGEEGRGGNYLPSTMYSLDDENAVLDWSDIKEYKFGNTSLYSPVSYLPHAVAMSITERCFTNSTMRVFYAGRMGGFITCMILSIAALWVIPFGRKILFMIIFNPMSFQEMISMAPDGITIALSVFLISYVLYLSYRSQKIKMFDCALLTAICFVLSQCKIVYIVLILLLLIIPQDKFANKRSSILYKAGVLFVTVGFNLLWLAISAGYLVEFQPGVNSSEQVKYVLGNLLNYYSVAVRTTIENGAFFVHTMFGSDLGAFTIEVPHIVWISTLIVFIYQIVSNRDIPLKTHARDKYIMIIVFLLGTALIYTSLYVQWTPFQNAVINGIQGRYFIPIIALPAFSAMYCLRDRETMQGNMAVYQTKSSYFYVLLLLFNGITVLQIINYYSII